MEFEDDMFAKCGPLSIQKPWAERISDLENYYKDIICKADRFTDKDILATSKKLFARNNILARSLDKTVEHMKKSTNSGTPYFSRRNAVLDQTLDWLKSKYNSLNDKL